MPPREPVPPGPGQESVWDYPRPPACVRSDRHVVVRAGDRVVADTRRALRILETSHPPTWYLPREDVDESLIEPSQASSTWCEWKGTAGYWDVARRRAAAWSYERPSRGYEQIAGFLAFSPRALDCFVDGERVRAQEGGFYAGWITADIVGPFKGGPGTAGW